MTTRRWQPRLERLREAHLPGDPEFRAANKCRNRRGDISNPDPVAVARVHSVSEVEAAVQCVVAAGIDACARAGAHGFENDACCSGGGSALTSL